MCNCCMQFLQRAKIITHLFSPLDKLADRAILPMFFLYFLDIFNGRHFNTCFSEPNVQIFTKISRLVDGWKGLLTCYLRSIK